MIRKIIIVTMVSIAVGFLWLAWTAYVDGEWDVPGDRYRLRRGGWTYRLSWASSPLTKRRCFGNEPDWIVYRQGPIDIASKNFHWLSVRSEALVTAAAILAAYPVIAFVRGPLRRYHRRKRGLCVACAYDLRGSPEPCPECATKVETE